MFQYLKIFKVVVKKIAVRRNMNMCLPILLIFIFLFRSSTISWIFVKGMHTTFTLSQAGDLGNIKNVFFQLVKSVECNTVAAKSISTENLNRTNRQKLDVICNTSNNFHIKSLKVIKYVKNNLPIVGVDWLLPLHQVRKETRGQEDFWQLNGLASKFNSSWHVRRLGLSGIWFCCVSNDRVQPD